MEYRQTQWSGFGFPILILFLTLFVATVITEGATTLDTAILAILGVLVVVGAVFARLTVTVSDDRVTATFLFGWPRRVVDLSDVVAIRRVRNLWWHGLGVRRLIGGWSYNVWGLDAVELELASGDIFRIGSTDPDVLYDVLASATDS